MSCSLSNCFPTRLRTAHSVWTAICAQASALTQSITGNSAPAKQTRRLWPQSKVRKEHIDEENSCSVNTIVRSDHRLRPAACSFTVEASYPRPCSQSSETCYHECVSDHRSASN